MISSRAGKDPVITPTASLPANAVGPFLPASNTVSSGLWSQPARHLRGLFQLGSQRRAVAFALCAVSASGIATAAAAFATVQRMHSAQVEPLAPAPAARISAEAPSPPKLKHHLFGSFNGNALHVFAGNPLHVIHGNPLRGIASWYGSVLHGHKTASGESFDETDLTACHRSLPFGTLVRVTDTSSLRSVIVRINDRGVLAPDRVIDLSSAAADKLGILRSGVAQVRLEVLHTVKPAPPVAAEND